MSMTGNDTKTIKVEYIGDDAFGFVKGRIYNAIKAKTKFGNTEMYCIKDDSNEEYAYPASWFRIIES